MDSRLLTWARAAAARGKARQPKLPVLWLFTDRRRLPDPLAAATRLPKGLAGVVLRHDGEPERLALGRDLARICRMRRLTLVVAGDGRLAAALGAGVHLRGGQWPDRTRLRRRLVTSSAHTVADLHRARRARAALVFVSPAFSTASHTGASPLGAHRWTALARMAKVPVVALGGIDGASVRRLPPPLCQGAAAIGALA